ncbi:Histamine H2 receptor [Trichoplax sp. H2]|nr:Histamine H2 receptor [Trichoplax sp. H2]|eukprot:RDD40437.1 Histamine H2 receptor [Trichoplax sp. H2]
MSSYDNFTNLDNGSQSTRDSLGFGEYVISSVYALIAFISVTSNLMFCLIIYNYKKKSSTAKAIEYLFMNLAIADMIGGILLVIVPGFVIPKPIYPIPHVGLDVFCSLIWSNSLFFLAGFISAWTLLTISIDRWCAIARPFSYKEFCTKKKMLIMIVIIWIANIGLEIPNILSFAANPNGTGCQSSNWVGSVDRKAIVTVVQLIRIFIPSFIIAVVYMDIGWRILFAGCHKRIRTDSNLSANINHTSQRDALIRKQVTIMSFIAAIVFLICWLPNETYYTAALYHPRLFKNVTFRRVTKLLTGLNSALNPLIYAISNKFYRQAFMELLHCRISKIGAVKNPLYFPVFVSRHTALVKPSEIGI